MIESSAEPSELSRRHAAIDFIRAFSILWIVGIWHVFDYLPELYGGKNAATYRVTVALLGLFVLVSGYLMGLKEVYLKPRPLKNFYIGRFGRIYPPFVLACLVFMVLKLGDSTALTKAALLVAMLWGPPPFTLWFIAMIALFYAATPFLIAARRDLKTFGLIVFSLTTFAALAHLQWPTFDSRLAIYLPSYCMGLWLAKSPIRWIQLFGLGLAMAIPSFMLSLLSEPRALESSLWSMPWALALSVMCFGGAMAWEPRLPRWRSILFVSQASYFLYLFHRPVYAAFLKPYDPPDLPSRAALLVLLALPVAIVGAWIAQRCYDEIWAGIKSPKAH
jgi:peptidoglycan/LPS O-acetylase OafA/YrhL